MAISENDVNKVKRLAHMTDFPSTELFVQACNLPIPPKHETMSAIIRYFDLNVDTILRERIAYKTSPFARFLNIQQASVDVLLQHGAKWPYDIDPNPPEWVVQRNAAKDRCVALLWARQCDKQMIQLDLVKELIEEMLSM